MPTSPKTHLLVVCFGPALAALMIAAPPALACACCSETGSRYVEVEKISAQRANVIEQMRFAGTAKLVTGPADIAIKGITEPRENYTLAVARQNDRLVFSLRDDKQRTGTLALAMPQTISIFEVDPREGKESGTGPNLYKEWKLTANAAGGGLFAAVVGAGQKMTLVLHGRGNNCTDAGSFTAWTLLVYGPAGKFSLYGALKP